MKQVFLMILILILVSCNIHEDSRAIPKNRVEQESSSFKKGKLQLKQMGFTNIKQESYPFFCCAEDDNILFSTGFSAYTSDGEKVEGCMCSAFLKGVTIRFK